MKYYETLYIINPNLADEDYKDAVTKFHKLVEKNKGVVIKVDEWGKKTLAYQVKKFGKGNYVLLQYCGESGITTELEKDLKLDDRVLKYQTIKLSNKADPEELKAQVKEDEVKVVEAEAPPVEPGVEEEGEKEMNEEGENGIQ